MAITEYYHKVVKGSRTTTMIISHADADGVVSAFINTMFAPLYTTMNSNILVLGSIAPGSDSTMSTFKYGLAKCIEYFGKGFSADDFRIIICDRDFFTVDQYKYIRDNYGIYTKNLKFYCIDHHATNKLIDENSEFKTLLHDNLDIHMWIDITKDWSGANLSLDMWKDDVETYGLFENRRKLYGLSFDRFEKLVEATKNWDTFTWRDMPEKDQIEAQELNSLCSILGAKSMFDLLMSHAESEDIFKSIVDVRKLCYSSMQNKLQDCLDSNLWRMNTEVANLGDQLIKLAYLFGIDAEYQSMFAQRIFEMDKYYDVDVVAFVNYYGTVSVRIREGKETIVNGSELATYARDKFGTSGGGHPNACGFTIDYNETRKKELGQKMLDAFYGLLGLPAPEFKIDKK